MKKEKNKNKDMWNTLIEVVYGEGGLKHRTLYAVFLFILGIGMLIGFFIWENPIEEYSFGFEGRGTQNAPYQIHSVEDLERLRDLVNDGERFLNIYFEQQKDLDLAEIDNWVSIGEFGKGNYFYGIYDGAGHTVSSLTSVNNSGNSGLFGMLGGKVKNLGIESGYIEGSCVGSITSHGMPAAAIINCYNKATVHGIERAGGIADNLGGGYIQDSWNLGEVYADSGINYGISSYSAVIEHCFCVDLVPAPEPESKVTDTVTFQIEELDDVYGKWALCQDNDREIPSLKAGSQTIFFVQKNRRTEFIAWFKSYWLLLAAVSVAAVLAGAACVSAKGKWGLCRQEAVSGTMGASPEDKSDADSGTHKCKRVWYAVAFVLTCICGLAALNQILVLKRDDGVITMRNYYKQPKGSVDVLFLGSSRVGVNLDLETLWKYYGISSYACWGSVQPFWNSYYFLKEAADASRPELVVLEVGAASNFFEYSDEERQYTNTFGIRNLLHRIQAVQVSAPQDRWGSLILGFPIYHSRFQELTKNDFIQFGSDRDAENYKGNSVRYGTGSHELEDISDITQTEKIYVKEEMYLNKILEYCRKEKLPILLMAMPHPSRIYNQPYLNAVARIADENKVPFLNFNHLDAQTGFVAEDFWIDNHMNTSGGRKIADYLGQYLKANYMLSDHRGDEFYKSWDIFADNMENDYLRAITGAEDYFSELARDGRTAVVIRRDVPEGSQAYASFLLDIADTGMDLSFLTEEERSCYVVSANEKHSYDCTQECRPDETGGIGLRIDFAHTDKVYIDEEEVYTLPQSGVVCMAYDPFKEEIVDIAVFSEDTQYTAVHQ